MIVHRDHEELADTRAFLAGCRAQAAALDARPGSGHDAVTGLLIDIGMLEAGLIDRLCPEADGFCPFTRAMRQASLAAGRLFYRSWRAAPVSGIRTAALMLVTALDQVAAYELPASITLRTPEGYAYYALYPETYAEAARRFLQRSAPARTVCLGLRSIGTSLAAVVAATLEAEGRRVESATLRPRGHPFDRRPVLAPSMEEWLHERLGATFLIVDEGPGLSGSSICGTAELLSALGVPDGQIVFFPSRPIDAAALVARSARARWPRHQAFHASFEEVVLPRAPWAEGCAEVSGGAWRSLLYADETIWPPVLPALERRKFLCHANGRPAVLHRFAGLGRFGARSQLRASQLAAAGFTPPVLGLRQGFLAQRFVDGHPLRPWAAEPRFLGFAARYLGHLGRHFATGRPARPEWLLPMILTNVAGALGEAALPDAERLARHVERLPEAAAVALDGRVLPHEWLATVDGYVKTDALDHHADHAFPGPADIAWDVAALTVEFELPADRAASFSDAAASALGDPLLVRRLPFYTVAYLAFRAGQASPGATVMGGHDEGRRLQGAGTRYRAQLAHGLGRLTALI